MCVYIYIFIYLKRLLLYFRSVYMVGIRISSNLFFKAKIIIRAIMSLALTLLCGHLQALPCFLRLFLSIPQYLAYCLLVHG